MLWSIYSTQCIFEWFAAFKNKVPFFPKKTHSYPSVSLFGRGHWYETLGRFNFCFGQQYVKHSRAKTCYLEKGKFCCCFMEITDCEECFTKLFSILFSAENANIICSFGHFIKQCQKTTLVYFAAYVDPLWSANMEIYESFK